MEFLALTLSTFIAACELLLLCQLLQCRNVKSTPLPVDTPSILRQLYYVYKYICCFSEPDVAPNCKISNEEGQLYLLSDQEFRDLRTHEGILDQALAAHYPEWANYTQSVPWSTQPVKLGKS
jgi:hypothetical protein